MVSGSWIKSVKKFFSRIWPVFFIGMHTQAYASTGGSLPFASAMQILQTEITKAWLPAASIVLFVTTCLMLAFGVASFISVMFGGGAVM